MDPGEDFKPPPGTKFRLKEAQFFAAAVVVGAVVSGAFVVGSAVVGSGAFVVVSSGVGSAVVSSGVGSGSGVEPPVPTFTRSAYGL